MRDLEYEEDGNVVTMVVYIGIAVATAAAGFVGGAIFGRRKTKQILNESIIRLAKANKLKLPDELTEVEAQLAKRAVNVKVADNTKHN